MNAKRILSLFLAAVLTLGVAVTPAVAASAAPALPGSAALEESNGPVSIKLTASGRDAVSGGGAGHQGRGKRLCDPGLLR